MKSRYLYKDFKDPLSEDKDQDLSEGEERKKGSENKRKKKVNNKDLDEKVSVVSKITNRTASGALKRHCEPCNRLIVNWADHKKNLHGGNEVEYEKCGLNCFHCKGKYFKFSCEIYRLTYRMATYRTYRMAADLSDGDLSDLSDGG